MKIKKLEREVILRIRAGEVIEDPASCVKELIENSIDAKATEISIYVEDGGKRKIVVKDNGTGMDRDELSMAVEPFTTSKIDKVDDLKRIVSFGFRGEALSAIARVSRLRIKSSKDNSYEGWEIIVEGGEKKYISPVPHPKGTTCEVKDLFYSVPARRKFLKGSFLEMKKIAELVTKYALSHPDISFSLKNEREEILNLERTESFEQRIKDIFGEEYFKELFKIEEQRKNFAFTLFISRELFLKENPVRMFFINRRPFYDSSFSKAFSTVYSERIKSPDVYLFLFVPPELYDVNVHPQKLQVKFRDSLGFPFRIVNIVKKRLEENFKKELKKRVFFTKLEGVKKEGAVQLELGESFVSEKRSSVPVYKDMWQLENTYIVLKFEKGILVIDQHTAHEKVLYERLKSRERVSSKNLAFPFSIKLTPEEFYTFKDIEKVLEEKGFKIRILKGREIQIEAIPEFIEKLNKEQFLEFIEALKGERKLDPDNIYKNIACKSAVKSGDILTKEEMTELVLDLLSLEDPFFCPHGRPVMIQYTKEDFDKRFGR